MLKIDRVDLGSILSNMTTTVACQIYLPDGTPTSIRYVDKTTTIAELLPDRDVIVFTSTHGDREGTPIIDWTRTLVDLNMWFPEPKYIAQISLYKENDIHLYNRELYLMYVAHSEQHE